MTRAFARWGGFYPHHRFSPYTDEEVQIVLGGRIVDNVEELTEGQRQQAETIRLAMQRTRCEMHWFVQGHAWRTTANLTMAWRSVMVVKVVLDWEVGRALGSVEDTAAVADVDATPVENAQRSTSRAGGVSTPFEPNVSAAEIEETRNAVQSLANSVVRSKASATPPPEKAERTTFENSRPTSSQYSPTPPSKNASVSQEPGSSEGTSQVSPQQVSPSTTKSTNNLPEGARAAPAEVVNNRTRTEEAEQERAGFKVKLLGWLG